MFSTVQNLLKAVTTDQLALLMKQILNNKMLCKHLLVSSIFFAKLRILRGSELPLVFLELFATSCAV